VPEASVIRRLQALSGVIGRKGLGRWLDASEVKSHGSTVNMLPIRSNWNIAGASRTVQVGVKSVDMHWNTKGVGS